MEELIREWERYAKFQKKYAKEFYDRGGICPENMYKPTFEKFIEFYKNNN